MAEEKREVYYIPPNYKVPNKWKRIYIRNLIEAAIVAGGIFALVWSTSLKWQIKSVIGLAAAALAGAFFINGIHGRSVTEFIINYIRFVFTRRDYHFKKVEAIYGEANKNRENNQGGSDTAGKSRLEKILEKHKKKKEPKK